MSRSMRFLSMIFVAVYLAASGGSAHAKEPYRIGVVVAATGSASFLGEPEKNTIMMLTEQINKAGGINGHPLEVFIEDSKSDETTAVLSAKMLLEKKVSVMLGSSTTGETMALVPVMTNAKVPLISIASGAVIVQPVEERHWIFKSPQNDSSMIEKIYEHIKKQGVSKVGILSVISSFGDSSRKALLELAPRYGITVVVDERYGAKDPDMTSQLVKARAAGAQAIINMSIGPSQIIVTKNWHALKMGIPLYQSHGWGTKKNIELAGKAAEGVHAPLVRLVVWDKLPDKHPQKALLKKYALDYEARFKAEPAVFGGYATDAFMMAVDALRKVGSDSSRIRDFIENKINKWPGLSGVYKMSPKDHCGLDKDSMDMVVVKNGDWEILK